MKNVVHFEYKQNLKHDVTELLITVQYSLMPSNLKPPLAKERKKVFSSEKYFHTWASLFLT